MFDKYFSKQQMDELAKRRETLGDDQIRAVENEWPELIGNVRGEMERGTDPADPRSNPWRWR